LRIFIASNYKDEFAHPELIRALTRYPTTVTCFVASRRE
jgi:hypothetical protein